MASKTQCITLNVGTGVWVVPDGLTSIELSMVGGGGAGGCVGPATAVGGGGGGAGETIQTLPLKVVPGESIPYTVGAKGLQAGTSSPGVGTGGDGGGSSFGPGTFFQAQTCAGGVGGVGGNASSGNSGAGGGRLRGISVGPGNNGLVGGWEYPYATAGGSGSSSSNTASNNPTYGASGPGFLGGQSGIAHNPAGNVGGGGGASTAWGVGGAGGDGALTALGLGADATAPLSTAYGVGGGGGGGVGIGVSGGSVTLGSDGGDGIIQLFYLAP